MNFEEYILNPNLNVLKKGKNLEKTGLEMYKKRQILMMKVSIKSI